MLSVIMLNDIMLDVIVPILQNERAFKSKNARNSDNGITYLAFLGKCNIKQDCFSDLSHLPRKPKRVMPLSL